MTRTEATEILRDRFYEYGLVNLDDSGEACGGVQFDGLPKADDYAPDGDSCLVYRIEFIPVRLVSKGKTTKEFT